MIVSAQRQEQNRTCTAKMRASETVVEAAQRRKVDRACKAKKRASETDRNSTMTRAKPNMRGQKKSRSCSHGKMHC